MPTKTKLISSLMPGAPVLNGTPGSLLAVFDAALNTGLGLTPVTALSVTGGIATLTLPMGHSMIPNCVALIAGATPAGLNGEKRIISTSANSAAFDATGILNGAATGTITAKIARLGWTKSFTGTNVASYKMTDVEGTGFTLRVDDTSPTAARVRGYETMSDVGTGTGLFPSLAQIADSGLYWSKSATADTTARAWYVLGDSQGFALFVNNYGPASAFQSFYFGDFLSRKSNDPYACLIRGYTSNQAASQSVFGEDLAYADSAGVNGGMYVARAANTLGGSVPMTSCPTLTIGLALQHITGSTGWSYPANVDNGLTLCPLMLSSAGTGYRGVLPGISSSPQYTAPSFSTGDYVEGTGAMTGKKVMVIKIGAAVVNGNQGVLFVDPISDWRA